MARRQNKKQNPRHQNPFNTKNLWKYNRLEMITAALLLSGILSVNSIQITRKGTLSVILYGEFLEDIGQIINMDDHTFQEFISLFQKKSKR
ncbi:hypothetical protein [Tepidibacillus decaturensis]|uniref:Uncharacterized protein n=1 Tax=Tepidibacillus decaturensis TaxID=1413211 RepID=A0A135L3C9_9BACI|nr:hypothetical protein [Tepidibacillus decaturensis]KXG43534.1 hypothetical protein U473_05520 [Tepidibacillus decaturensis]